MIVIPMAGLSQRFRDAGYALPKYMLDLHGRTLFSWTVGSFERYFATEPFLFIARDEAGTPGFIEREIAKLGIAEARTVILSHPTKGQAETVRLGIERNTIQGDQPLTIFNIDTIRPGFCYPDRPWMSTADGYIEVMRASDPGFSYAAPAETGDERVKETAEKNVISDLASTGLYYFRRSKDFIATLEKEEINPSSHELYIAPLYNFLIQTGQDVRYAEVPSDQVLFAGTPAQYDDLLKRKSI